MVTGSCASKTGLTMRLTNQGVFVNDSMEGFGKFVWPNSKVYEGDWLDNKINGKGKIIYSNGVIFEGSFVNNRKEGKGQVTFPDGRVTTDDYKAGKNRKQYRMSVTTIKDQEKLSAGDVSSVKSNESV